MSLNTTCLKTFFSQYDYEATYYGNAEKRGAKKDYWGPYNNKHHIGMTLCYIPFRSIKLVEYRMKICPSIDTEKI